MALEELNAKNKIGWNDGRIRLDGKTKIVDRCRDAFTGTYPVVSPKLSYLCNATKVIFWHILVARRLLIVISKLAFIANLKNNPQKHP